MDWNLRSGEKSVEIIGWIICIVGASTPAAGSRYLALQNVANGKVVAMSSCYIKKVDGPAILRPALLLGDFAPGETNWREKGA